MGAQEMAVYVEGAGAGGYLMSTDTCHNPSMPPDLVRLLAVVVYIVLP